MTARNLLFTVCMIILSISANGQDTIHIDLGGHAVTAIIKDGDTIYVSQLQQAVISPASRKAATRDLRQYRRLVYNVKKVYPYAKIAGAKFAEVNSNLQNLKKGKDQREYIRQVEDEILKRYEEELKDLTVTQGRILIKLIDRETTYTSYEVVKELRGSFQAAFWQAIARIFGSNLKTEFDPEGEDKVLNEIMILIETGQL